MKPNLIKIEKLVKSKKAIVINQKFITRILGFDDMRDFAESLHDFGYTTDFTYLDYQTESWQSFLRRYLKEGFLN